MLLTSWPFRIHWEGVRSFHKFDIGSVGQRAAKLPSIKPWECFRPGRSRTWADWFVKGRAQIFLRPPTLTACEFAALWPTDPILPVWKDEKHEYYQFNLLDAFLGSILLSQIDPILIGLNVQGVFVIFSSTVCTASFQHTINSQIFYTLKTKSHIISAGS